MKDFRVLYDITYEDIAEYCSELNVKSCNKDIYLYAGRSYHPLITTFGIVLRDITGRDTLWMCRDDSYDEVISRMMEDGYIEIIRGEVC